MASMYKSDSKPIVYTPHGNASRVDAGEATGTLTAQMGLGGGNVPMVYCPGGSNRKGAVHEQDYMSALDGKGGNGGAARAVVFARQRYNHYRISDNATTLRAHAQDLGSSDVINDQGGLRFLTPEECERLQGIPSGFTMIPWRGKLAEQCPTGHRYQAIGNAICVPVLRWLLGRIDFVDGITAK